MKVLIILKNNNNFLLTPQRYFVRARAPLYLCKKINRAHLGPPPRPHPHTCTPHPITSINI